MDICCRFKQTSFIWVTRLCLPMITHIVSTMVSTVIHFIDCCRTHQWNLMKILLAVIIILLSQSGHKFVHAIPAVYILLQDYNGLAPSRWQTIIWTNSCCFLVGQMAYVEEVVFLLILSRCPHPCNSNEHAIVLLFRLGHAIKFQYE